MNGVVLRKPITVNAILDKATELSRAEQAECERYLAAKDEPAAKYHETRMRTYDRAATILALMIQHEVTLLPTSGDEWLVPESGNVQAGQRYRATPNTCNCKGGLTRGHFCQHQAAMDAFWELIDPEQAALWRKGRWDKAPHTHLAEVERG